MPFKTVGSRAEVFHGTAKHTSGGLTKSELMKNKHGRIVSRKKHTSAKRENRLLKYGFGTRKGHFGAVRLDSRGRSRSRRGGGFAGVNDSYMISDVTPQSFGPLQRALVGGGNQPSKTLYGGTANRRSLYGGTANRRSLYGGMAGALQPADVNARAVGGLEADGPVIGQTSYNGMDDATALQIRAGMTGGRRRRRRHRR